MCFFNWNVLIQSFLEIVCLSPEMGKCYQIAHYILAVLVEYMRVKGSTVSTVDDIWKNIFHTYD